MSGDGEAGPTRGPMTTKERSHECHTCYSSIILDLPTWVVVGGGVEHSPPDHN